MKLTLAPTCRRAGRAQLLLSCDADHPGHLVEVEALAALDRPLVVVVFPWGQHEQPTVSAGIKPATTRLGKRSEAILLKHNNRESMLECRLHHSFLPRADARRDEDCSVLSM